MASNIITKTTFLWLLCILSYFCGNSVSGLHHIDETMITKASIDETMITKASIDETMITKASIDETMITKASIDETMITKASIDKIMVTKASVKMTQCFISIISIGLYIRL